MCRTFIKIQICLAVAVAGALGAFAGEFHSGSAVLGISNRNGALEYVHGADGMMRTVASAEAFTLQLLDGRGEPTRLKSTDFSFSCKGNRLEWRHANGLHVQVEVSVADGGFRFKPSVDGIPSGMLLEWFDGPQVCVPVDATLFWPLVDGIEVTDATRRRRPYRPLGFRDRNWSGDYNFYPSYCQMQFLAAYKGGEGVYFAAVDDRHTPKGIDWELIDGKSIRFSLQTFCGDLTLILSYSASVSSKIGIRVLSISTATTLSYLSQS